MNTKSLALYLFLSLAFFSCVSSKKYKKLNEDYSSLNNRLAELQKEIQSCKNEKTESDVKRAMADTKRDAEDIKREGEIASLRDQVEFLKKNNNTALKQLQDLSVISSSQAESIKKSLENISAKDSYIQSIQQAAARKDSLNMALVMNLKGALGDLNDQDINIKVDKGVVYVDISDKVLFETGSFSLNNNAKTILGKVATVLKAQPDLEYMVEGHTDNVTLNGSDMLQDNWDLSVKRATTIVRLLQKQYGLNPAQLVAAGRSEYRPLSDNTTPEGRARNRRTRIIVLPQLDQFFKLLEKK